MMGVGALGELALGQLSGPPAQPMVATGLSIAMGRSSGRGASIVQARLTTQTKGKSPPPPTITATILRALGLSATKGRQQTKGITPLLASGQTQLFGFPNPLAIMPFAARTLGAISGQPSFNQVVGLTGRFLSLLVARAARPFGIVPIAAAGYSRIQGRDRPFILTPIQAVSRGVLKGALALTEALALRTHGSAQSQGRLAVIVRTTLAACSMAMSKGRVPFSVGVAAARAYAKTQAGGRSFQIGATSLRATGRAKGSAKSGSVYTFLRTIALASSSGQMLFPIGQQPLALRTIGIASTFGQLAKFFLPTFITDPRFIATGREPYPGFTGITRCFVTAACPRNTIATPKVVPWCSNMPYGNDFSVVDATVEKVTLTFNFAPWLGPGVAIIGVQGITVTNATESTVIDPNPQGILTGGAQIGPSPTTGAQGTAVLQQVANCQANVIYTLQCLVATSDNQLLNLASHLPCDTIH